MRDPLPNARDLAPARALPLVSWLLTCAVMVAVMVGLGGLTRLTGSGLSMVQWNPHHILPPLSEAQWREAFALYQATPEYQLVNSAMDLAGFKGIFWLEYVHRLWGRLIGLAFALPLAVFAVKGAIDRPLARRLGLLLALGAAQGGMGWYMVASGLVDRPEVSHFRLAAHLVLAVVILGLLLWTALDVARPKVVPAPDSGKARRTLVGLLGLTMATIIWGAFVAGLHAGHIHNSFPLMDGNWFPVEGLRLDPPLRNAVENPAAVQYVHRVLALTTLVCVTLFGLWCRLARLPAAARRPLALAGLFVWLQAGLGITTLLLAVPVPLAALHQMGAVVLFALLTWVLHTVRSG
ncbi:MAG: COX15/CtaA family protein [Rhodospirillaceae bacterium]|nr:COX15/CtaA family protein [Rhodospirillales bacterium]